MNEATKALLLNAPHGALYEIACVALTQIAIDAAPSVSFEGATLRDVYMKRGAAVEALCELLRRELVRRVAK